MSLVILIFGLVLFVGLIILHELGHFWVARRNGVVAEEFGIFFPPRLYRRKTRKGWFFSINLLPIGGFVKLRGEHDTDQEPGSFGAASLWSKVKIMLAGVGMNLLTAVILLTFLALAGLPQLFGNQFNFHSTGSAKQNIIATSVQLHSPAASIGLVPDSQIVAVGLPGHARDVQSISQLQSITKEYAGREVEVVYKSGGITQRANVKLLSQAVVSASLNTNQPKGYLGITLTSFTLRHYSWWSAPIEAIGLIVQFTKLTFAGLGHALAGLGSLIAGLVTHNTVARQHGQTEASAQVAGPVGIFFILKETSVLGLRFMLMIVAVISLTLAIMNVLPIPALDGGRMWMMVISRAFGKPLSTGVEEMVNAAGMVLLLVLVVLVTVVDVNRFF